MNNIEFGKEIQKLSKYFKLNNGSRLELKFSINEETGYLSSRVYNGTDYPKDRTLLLKFLEKKIEEYLVDRMSFLIKPEVINSKVKNVSVLFNLTDGSTKKINKITQENKEYLVCCILNFFIDYYEGNKSRELCFSDEENVFYLFKIENDKLMVSVNSIDYEILGTVDEISEAVRVHFDIYNKEWSNVCSDKELVEYLNKKLQDLWFAKYRRQRNKLDKDFKKNKIFAIDILIFFKQVIRCGLWFKLKDGKEETLPDLLDYEVLPLDLLNLFIDYYKGVKNPYIGLFEEEMCNFILKINNDKLFLGFTEEEGEGDELMGEPKDYALETLSHFRNFEKEWQNATGEFGEEEYLKPGEIKKLCDELESLIK